MPLEIILSLAIGAWLAVILLVMSLCRAAKRSEEAMDAALAHAIAAQREAETARGSSSGRPLRTLSLEEAADLLDVHPHTVLAWEARYEFPRSSPTERCYNRSEVLALRDSLKDGLSIASAVARAQARIKRRGTAATAQPVEHRDGSLASQRDGDFR